MVKGLRHLQKVHLDEKIIFLISKNEDEYNFNDSSYSLPIGYVSGRSGVLRVSENGSHHKKEEEEGGGGIGR